MPQRASDGGRPSAPPRTSPQDRNPRSHLGRGFNWLGGATILARIVDVSTILTLLHFLTKQQVGVASVVVSVGMVVEAFSGFGTSEALLQARSVTRLQLDTLFWYIAAAAIVVGGLTMLAAPGIGAIYGPQQETVYFLAVAIKQPLVGAALIPLALMNRDLQYERIAIVNAGATIAAALTRLVLAASGAGVWAIVGGYSASGLYILLGASLARPFRPAFRFDLPAIAPLARFGSRAAAANIAEQMFKNVDFLLIGWFYGAAPLAVYRVAFDIAMEPAMAVSTLVNRTVLPVFARTAIADGQLAPILTWALRRTALLVAPLAVALMLAADQITSLIGEGQGGTYAAAALPLKILAAAAMLRVASQLLPAIMLASGQPGHAARLSAATFMVLSVGIALVGVTLPAGPGLAAAAFVWFAAYLFLLAWGGNYVRQHLAIRPATLLRALSGPFVGVTLMVATFMLVAHLIGSGDAALRIVIVSVVTMMTYAGLFLAARRRDPAVA